MLPFSPSSATVNISVGTSTGNVKVCAGQRGEIQVRCMNNSTGTVFLAWGGNAIQATTAGLPVPAGGVEVLTLTAPYQDDLWIAAITTGTITGNIYFTPGAGI